MHTILDKLEHPVAAVEKIDSTYKNAFQYTVLLVMMMIKMNYSESCRCRRRRRSSASVFSLFVTTFFLLSLLGNEKNNVKSWSYSPNNAVTSPTSRRRSPLMTATTTTTTTTTTMSRQQQKQPSTSTSTSTSTTALFGMYDNPANPITTNPNNNSNDKNIIDEDEYMEIANLTLNQIIELIELSFFQGCYALSKGDTEPLKMFIVAVQTFAYKQQNEHVENGTENYVDSNGDSSITVSTMSSMITNPLNGRTSPVRPLEEEEMELRDTWIHAICLITTHVVATQELEEQQQDQDDDDDDSSLTTTATATLDENNDDSNDENDTDIAIKVKMIYGPILNDLIAIHQSKLGLNVNQFIKSRKEILFPTNNDNNQDKNDNDNEKEIRKNNNNNILALDNDDDDNNSSPRPVVDEMNNDINIDPMEYAIVAQTINVLYNTLEVLSDDEDAIVIDDAATASAPAPADATAAVDAVIEEETASTTKKGKSSKKKKKKQQQSNSSGKGFGA